ncbi:MAG TPA: MarR family transcriptional regulator [Bacteroidia bacterium]|nr:MarR family transcriptional regulator [Bacteroidia bacterium]
MEKEKKQDLISEKFFAEMRETFFFQIHRIQKSIFRKGNQLFQNGEINLQVEQFPILLSAYSFEGMSQQEIADVTHRDKSSIQRTLVALEKKGLVTIVQDASDKRKNLVYVTEEGKTIAGKIKKLLKQAEEEALSILSDEERRTAITTLKGIADKLDTK